MAWDWDKLQKQKGGTGGGYEGPPNVNDIIDKIKSATGKFRGGTWIIIIAIILFFLGPVVSIQSAWLRWESSRGLVNLSG